MFGNDMFGNGRRGGYGKGRCGNGYGLGAGMGLSPAGVPRGTGRIIYMALASGPKTEAEIKESIGKLTGFQPTFSLEPILDFWAVRGTLKKAEDGKYELVAPAAPWWI